MCDRTWGVRAESQSVGKAGLQLRIMSSRHLRRVKERLQSSVAEESSDDEAEEDHADLSKTKPFNPFDLLSDDDEEVEVSLV